MAWSGKLNNPFFNFRKCFQIPQPIEDLTLSQTIVKHISFFLLVTALTAIHASRAYGQKVYLTNFKSEADKIIYVTEFKSEADMFVYETKFKSEAKPWSGLWYWTDFKSEADWKVCFTKFKSEANLKVYFTKFKSEAGPH